MVNSLSILNNIEERLRLNPSMYPYENQHVFRVKKNDRACEIYNYTPYTGNTEIGRCKPH
jgi:hypothetical protein